MPDTAIDLRGLTKQFGDYRAVKDLTLSVSAGEVVGFLGPNGAGKTTTLRMLTGLIRPSLGTALIDGHDIRTDTIAAKRATGYVPDGAFLYPKLTGREFLSFVGGIYRVPRDLAGRRAAELLSLFDLEEKANDLIEGYSHGMRQKVALAAALLHDPPVLLLDEPTSGLDPRSARVVKDLLIGLAARGRAVLFSTHVLEIAEQMCHRVAIINAGELVAVGTLDQLRADAREGEASLEELFLQLTGGPEMAELAAFLEGR